jgi:ribosomal protein S18 acetylase RimI-like enzyme
MICGYKWTPIDFPHDLPHTLYRCESESFKEESFIQFRGQIMKMKVSITSYSQEHQSAIRQILERIGWAEQYIIAAEQNADIFSRDQKAYGIYLAVLESTLIGFIYVQFHEWNRLTQIQGLAVDPQYQRQGIASMLVECAERFAKEKKTRGIYVDTPTLNHRGRSFYEAVGYIYGYEMPRYYEDDLDGVTYQKFFGDG